jgi:hypothetical protein
MLGAAAASLKGVMADEQTTVIQVRAVTEGTSVMGGPTQTSASTLEATTTGLPQELGAVEATEAGLLGERRAANVFLAEYATLEAGTHLLRWDGVDWEVMRVVQYEGAYTLAVVELMSDG